MLHRDIVFKEVDIPENLQRKKLLDSCVGHTVSFASLQCPRGSKPPT